MTPDIVERLRDPRIGDFGMNSKTGVVNEVGNAAANEVERLRSALAQSVETVREQMARIAHLERVQEAADAMRKCNYQPCELCKSHYDAVRKGEG